MIILWGIAGFAIGSCLVALVSIAAKREKPARLRAVCAVGALVLTLCYAKGMRLATAHPGASDFLVFSMAVLAGLAFMITRRTWAKHRSQ
ncbi:hypothetical protein [Kitasatospora sp. NPDC089509]|uniref:hypothetical protein n=1 Tax=Kitasatospora sp. NPDC089509 TaxID=3364079 RepID=UPI0038091607